MRDKVHLPRTQADVDAMTAAEIEAAIAELRRLQKASNPARVRRSVWGGGYGGGFCGRRLSRTPSVEEGWAEIADNLQGDWERIGRDLWIAVLKNSFSEKRD